MDIPNSLLPTFFPRYYAKHRRNEHHGTLLIKEKPSTPEERKKWFGSAPTPLPETNRNFRPESIRF